jgi:hypothetical protein
LTTLAKFGSTTLTVSQKKKSPTTTARRSATSGLQRRKMNVWATILTAIISTSVGAVVTAIVGNFKSGHAKNKAMQSGLQSLLRAEIIRQHEKYTDRGYCPIYAKDALRREYESYHLLGGNGVITDLYNDLIALPEFPPHPDNENKTED